MSKEYMRRFWKATGVRAVKTLCQAAIAGVGTAVMMGGVDWPYVASSSALAGILSVLTSISVGLPEVKFPSADEVK